MLTAYLRYLSRARDEHSLHSPFLFALYTQIIRSDNRREAAFIPIRNVQKSLRQSRSTIEVTDFGAGSRRASTQQDVAHQAGSDSGDVPVTTPSISATRQRVIGDIARTSQKPARFGRLLFRLVRHFKAKTILDLGTSFGLTTAYMAEAARLQNGNIQTFEGCPQIAQIARRNFAQLNIENVAITVGNLDETLGSHLNRIPLVDFVFFDANHRYEPTVRYFEMCLKAVHNDTVFVFDDIHWSTEMEQAWAHIKAHPAVTITVDLFWVGLVFFRKEQPKQNFVLRF